MDKPKRWHILWPGAVYAEGPLELWTNDDGFSSWRRIYTADRRVVRGVMRERFGYKRLPVGFECWPAD